MSDEGVRAMPIIKQLLRLRGGLASWWFDLTRHVHTRGQVPLEGLRTVGSAGGFAYLPTFAHVGPRLLRKLPTLNFEQYTFVDLGSGLGRMLFVAAERPFRRVQGIEFATELHERAVRNIQSYCEFWRRCTSIESFNVNAADFQFPDDNLVVYMFNPFGREVLETVFGRLNASLARHPRDVFVIMLQPDPSCLADTSPYLRLYREGFRFKIYRSHPQPPGRKEAGRTGSSDLRFPGAHRARC